MSIDPTLLGTVRDVKGASVSVALDDTTLSGLVLIGGRGYRIGQVGSFVRIGLGYLDLFGVVAQVGAGASPLTDGESEAGLRWMAVELVGEGFRGQGFRRGISQFPTIGDTVHIVTDDDLGKIYGSGITADHIKVGNIASADSIPAYLNVNKLVTRHSAVVGSTGSGKSTTVACILAAISDPNSFASSRVIVLDAHGEYPSALRDRASIYRITPDQARGEMALYIPYWAMSFDEFVALAFGDVDENARAVLLDLTLNLKRQAIEGSPKVGVTLETLTVDTPVPFSIRQLWYQLHVKVYATHTCAGSGQSDSTYAFIVENGEPQRGDPEKVLPPRFEPQVAQKIFLSASTLNIKRQIDALAVRLRDSRYDFLFNPGPWATAASGETDQDLSQLIDDWIGKPQISILDLSGVPATIVDNLVGALIRILQDAVFWGRNSSSGARERPLLIVLEEAHAYLGHAGGAAAQAVKRVVREGRKYGIGAMIVSQRPSEIDTTILSQCGTLIAMRLSNPADRSHVRSMVADGLEGVLGMLPILRTGEAIVVGEAVHLPIRTLLSQPSKDRTPDSRDPAVVEIDGPGGWNRAKEPANYDEFVAAWRSQDSTIGRRSVATMERVPVNSSNIASVGYDLGASILEIEFQDGRTYQYLDVPVHVYEAMIQSDSPGGVFHSEIKGSYRYERL